MSDSDACSDVPLRHRGSVHAMDWGWWAAGTPCTERTILQLSEYGKKEAQNPCAATKSCVGCRVPGGPRLGLSGGSKRCQWQVGGFMGMGAVSSTIGLESSWRAHHRKGRDLQSLSNEPK
jgi:hypothetical protein